MTSFARNRARASSRVRIRENILRLRIIVPVEDENLAWGGSSWVPLTPDGLAAGDLKPVNFTTLEGAMSYAEGQQFKVEQP
jgi:hypothetical protein